MSRRGAPQRAGAAHLAHARHVGEPNSAWIEFSNIKSGERHGRRAAAHPRLGAVALGALSRRAAQHDPAQRHVLFQPARHLPRARRQHRAHSRREVLRPAAAIEMVGGGVDNVQWGAILRSVSAHRSYRWVYKQNYRPWRIAEYLILNQAMPRSLRSCYDEINWRSTTSPSSTAAQCPATRRPRRRAAARTEATSTNLPVGSARVHRGLHRRATTGSGTRSPKPTTSPARWGHVDARLHRPCDALHASDAGATTASISCA